MENKALTVTFLVTASLFMSGTVSGALPARICPIFPPVSFIPHPTDCSRFIMCVLGDVEVLECPRGSIFNSQTERCEPGDPATCELFTAPPATTTTTTSTTSPTPPVTTTSTSTESTTMTETETHSTSNPESTTERLSTTEAEPTFEPDEPEQTTIRSTELPQFPTDSIPTTQATATTVEVPSTTTSTRIPTTTPPIHRCPPGGNGYIPNYTNCSRYFECINGVRHLRFCPEGLLFDSVTLKCTASEVAVCAGAVI